MWAGSRAGGGTPTHALLITNLEEQKPGRVLAVMNGLDGRRRSPRTPGNLLVIRGQAHSVHSSRHFGRLAVVAGSCGTLAGELRSVCPSDKGQD